MSEPALHSHLSDPSLIPLLTTARSQPALSTLTSLTSTALTAHSTTLRLNMGAPHRLLVEGPDRLVLTSFLAPRDARPETESTRAPSEAAGSEARNSKMVEGEEGEDEGEAGPPMLVALVSAPAGEGREAGRAAARLEKVGRELQREWATDGEGSTETR